MGTIMHGQLNKATGVHCRYGRAAVLQCCSWVGGHVPPPRWRLLGAGLGMQLQLQPAAEYNLQHFVN